MSDLETKLEPKADATRRAMLRRLGRFAAVTPPAVTVLLALSDKPARAQVLSTKISSRQFKTSGDGLAPDAGLAALSAIDGLVAADAVGLCLGAVKAIAARVTLLERELASSRF